MQTNFETNFKSIMARAGYSHISIPALLASPWDVAMWGRPAGSVAYYYVVYNLSTFDFADFSQLKGRVDQMVDVISNQHNMRHSVIFNIFTGVFDENVRDVERMVDSAGEFALLAKYDIYIGVDTANRRVLRNSKQPANMDGSVDKIQAALAADFDEMLHAQPSITRAVPVAKYPVLVFIIMGINLLLFMMMEMDGGSDNLDTLIRYGAAQYHMIFTFGEYHRLFTPIFLHIGAMHLMFNTASMLLFGIRAERYFGPWKFLVIYMVSGIVGNVAMVLTSEFAVGAGASGSIYGVMGALFAFTKVRKRAVETFNTATLGIMIFIGVLVGFTISGVPGMPNVANSAHIGGLVAGFGLGCVLAGKNRPA